MIKQTITTVKQTITVKKTNDKSENINLRIDYLNLFETSQSLFWASFGLVELEKFDLEGLGSFTRFWALLMFGSYSVINIISRKNADFNHKTVMRLLVRRYITEEQRKADEKGITEDDINEVKQDISTFSY
ncbi:Transient receptor potential protein [Armadillidium nasatum]|uniref:Transient receptor potential protein n=1 Tax=Armadillidium nasatum TaxID=96803 RepID=A0A5N5SVE4_9CRUS|nr:Transient receptor potential protein [Armadillidium nasatum]